MAVGPKDFGIKPVDGEIVIEFDAPALPPPKKRLLENHKKTTFDPEVGASGDQSPSPASAPVFDNVQPPGRGPGSRSSDVSQKIHDELSGLPDSVVASQPSRSMSDTPRAPRAFPTMPPQAASNPYSIPMPPPVSRPFAAPLEQGATESTSSTLSPVDNLEDGGEPEDITPGSFNAAPFNPASRRAAPVDRPMSHEARAVPFPQEPEIEDNMSDTQDDEFEDARDPIEHEKPNELKKKFGAEHPTDRRDVPRQETPNLPARPGHMLKRLLESEAEGGGTGAVKIGERLIARGWLTPEQLKVALQEKKMTGKMLGQVMLDLGFITDEQLSEVLAEASGYDVFDVKNTIVDGEALSIVTKEQAMKMQALPISKMDGEVMIAMVDPHDIVALDKLRRIIPKNMKLRPLLTTASVLSEAIDAAYGYSSDVEAILGEMDNSNPEELAKIPESGLYTHPIVRLVNTLVAEAVKTGISDLHWEPEENFVRLRYRLDGVLFTAQILHKKHWGAIAQRIKIMADMNIADKLSPQDGRFELKFGARSADFRVSVLPTVFGENIVMRVLDKSASILPMEKLGFSQANLEKISWAQTRPEGIIIVTGPTGSGKSTSLYSMINAINSVQVNIQTLEDPVEYSLPMIRQTAIREGVLDFGDGIRALLRQDPDIIFIGEIRDGTTAEMALKAAMTGHQVYTTLHTNDSFGAIPRLLDLGLKPGMIAGAVIAVFAQRLARRLCGSCKDEYHPGPEEAALMGFDSAHPPQIWRAHPGGCSACRGQGYKGRIALVEILTFDEELDEIVARAGTKGELRKKAIEKGFKSMKDDAILKIVEGITSFESAATCVDFTR